MRLHNSLYTIQSKQSQDDAAQYVLILSAEHEIYKAHFPGQPITPGVCLLQIAKELLEDNSGASLEIQQIKNVKFLSVVSPIDQTRVTFDLNHIVVLPKEIECRAQVKSEDGQQLAKLSFKCAKRE